MKIQNIVIGKPLVDIETLIGLNKKDFDNNEKEFTFFTEERFLPKILKDIGVVKSTSEIKRNRPDLRKTLIAPDCFMLKRGKIKIFVVVGK